MPDEERDINNEAFWRRLAANFAEAQMMLQQTAKELGIDLNAISNKQYAEHRKRQKELLDQEDLKKLANQYAKDSRQILEDKENWLIFSAPEQQIQAEMLSIIYWYQYFISVKSQRGLRGILDFDGNLDLEKLTDSQSDANGSIKIALIAIERSMMAWTQLLSNENSKQIRPLISLLEKIKQTAEKKFPIARDFVRSGFDEIETVM